jgi:anti-sigma-K factor RskA
VSTTDQFAELLEAYALGALDATEHAALEAHLAAGCPACTKALEEARWLVTQLAYVSPDAVPSDILRGRLMQIVRAGATAATCPPPSAKSAVTFWMWAAVAALLLAAVYSAWDARRLQIQVSDIHDRAIAEVVKREKIEQELAEVRREAAILADPASIKISLATSDPQLAALHAEWHSALGIVVSGQKIPQPASNRVLQLWLIPKSPGAKPIPSETVRPDAYGNFVLLVAAPPRQMAETKALAVTEEPPGGSPQPTTTPKWVGAIT